MAAFQRDFRARPTVSTVISKFPEMKQMDIENVNNYFSRCAVILTDLKPKITTGNVEFTLTVSNVCVETMAQVYGIIAERSRASNTLDRGRGPEFESRQGMAN